MAIFEPKDTIDYTPLQDGIPADLTIVKGDPIVKQDTLGFWLKDCESITEEVTIVAKMRQVLAAKATGTGTEIKSGDKLYFDIAAGTVSPTQITPGYCGTALEDAGVTDKTVLMEYDGRRYLETV